MALKPIGTLEAPLITSENIIRLRDLNYKSQSPHKIEIKKLIQKNRKCWGFISSSLSVNELLHASNWSAVDETDVAELNKSGKGDPYADARSTISDDGSGLASNKLIDKSVK